MLACEKNLGNAACTADGTALQNKAQEKARLRKGPEKKGIVVELELSRSPGTILVGM